MNMKARFTTFKLFLMQHLFVVGLVLLFVVLSFCSCGRAVADSMIQSDRDYIHSVFDSTGWGSSQWESVESVMDSCPYFLIFPHTDGVNYTLVLLPYNTNEYYDAFVNNGMTQGVSVSEPQLMPWIESPLDSSSDPDYEFGAYWGGLMPYSIGNIQYSDSRVAYRYYIFDSVNNGSLGYYGYGLDIYDYIYGNSSWNFYWYDRTIRGVNGFYGSNGSFSRTVDRSNVKCNFNSVIIRYSLTGFETFEQNVFPIEYTSDDRLKLSTSLTGDGSKLLNIDLSAFRGSYTPAAGYTFSDVTLHLDCDGTDVSYIINGSNSELVNSWTPFNNRYVYITPYSVFDLYSYVDVYINGVDFSLIHSSPGGSDTENFKISSEYFLKQTNIPPESESIPFDSDTQVDLLTQVEKDAEAYIVEFSHGEALSYSAYHSLDKPDVYEDDAYYVYMSNGGSFLQLLQLFDNWGHDTDDVVGFINSIDSDVDIMEGIGDYMKENAYASYASMVVFVYISDWTDFTAGNISSSDLTYYYYVTEVGRLRKISSQLGDLYIECNQIGHNTYAIYDFLYTRLNDFEQQSLNLTYDLIGLEKQNNSWLSTINSNSLSGFSSVVNAINNIDIPEPTVFDDSDILDRLDDLVNAVQGLLAGNEVDTPQECIQYYYNNLNGNVPLEFLPAYYEGRTLDFLYSLEGLSHSENRSKSRSNATFDVNSTLLDQLFTELRFSFVANHMGDHIKDFLSKITIDNSSSKYYWHLFHVDYDPEEFDGVTHE